MRYKHLSGHKESDGNGRNETFFPVRIETINALAEDGWRVVSCAFDDDGEIAAVVMEHD